MCMQGRPNLCFGGSEAAGHAELAKFDRFVSVEKATELAGLTEGDRCLLRKAVAVGTPDVVADLPKPLWPFVQQGSAAWLQLRLSVPITASTAFKRLGFGDLANTNLPPNYAASLGLLRSGPYAYLAGVYSAV